MWEGGPCFTPTTEEHAAAALLLLFSPRLLLSVRLDLLPALSCVNFLTLLYPPSLSLALPLPTDTTSVVSQARFYRKVYPLLPWLPSPE